MSRGLPLGSLVDVGVADERKLIGDWSMDKQITPSLIQETSSISFQEPRNLFRILAR
jgi:hypothetical protein